MTPDPLLTLPEHLFWGRMYPGSYLVGIGYFLANGSRELVTPDNLALIAGISAGWWGV